MKKTAIGLIGLAVMGENLVMNMESRGFTVALYNRTVEKVDKFCAGRAAGKNIIGCHSLEELRDYFGAHSYERVDAPRGEHFHTNWTGHGGATAAGTYNA